MKSINYERCYTMNRVKILSAVMSLVLLLQVINYQNNVIYVKATPFTRDNDDSVYSWHRNSDNKIALTFDDGPSSKYTEKILSILDEYNIKATFFVVGANAKEYPDIIKKEIACGHELANHTYSHANLRSLKFDIAKEELCKTERTIAEICNYRTRLIRPPGGKYSDGIKTLAESLDYKLVLWSIDTRDWAHSSVESICKNVLNNVVSGDIILFHDYIPHESPTPEALRIIIPTLIERGFSFVTVSELIGSE